MLRAIANLLPSTAFFWIYTSIAGNGTGAQLLKPAPTGQAICVLQMVRSQSHINSFKQVCAEVLGFLSTASR